MKSAVTCISRKEKIHIMNSPSDLHSQRFSSLVLPSINSHGGVGQSLLPSQFWDKGIVTSPLQTNSAKHEEILRNLDFCKM